MEATAGNCEIDTFHSNGTFDTTEFGGGAGKWSGGATITMKGTRDDNKGERFRGGFLTNPKGYGSSFSGLFAANGPRIKGAVAGCRESLKVRAFRRTPDRAS